MTKSFSLISQPWIPVTGFDKKSLREIFSTPFPSIGGNPIEQISIFKLLLAIAQSAITPKDEKDWLSLTAEGLAAKTLEYLHDHENNFDLYGTTPFLQMPQVASIPPKPFAVVISEIASGNTTVLTQTQTIRNYTDAELALYLVTMQNFAFGGKKTDNSLILTKGYNGKSKSGKPACSLEQSGLLHTYVQGQDIWETLWLNLWTENQLQTEKARALFPSGKGRAAWEKMPTGEDCSTAKLLRSSLLGRLVPLCRFCLIENQDIHLTEGIQYPSSKDHVFDTTVSITLGDKPKVLIVNPMKRPWRELTAILSTVQTQPTLYCAQLSIFNHHCRTLLNSNHQHLFKDVRFWSGGIRVSNKAGEQFVSGSDDYVASSFKLSLQELCESAWYSLFCEEIHWLNVKAKKLERCIHSYCEDMKLDTAITKLGENLFWTKVETLCQNIIDACAEKNHFEQQRAIKKIHLKVSEILTNIYSDLCPYNTSRQLMSWTKFHPNFSPAGKRKL